MMDEEKSENHRAGTSTVWEVIREILPAQSPALNPPDESVPVEQRRERFYKDYNIPEPGNWMANLGWGVTGLGPIDFDTVRKITSGQLPLT